MVANVPIEMLTSSTRAEPYSPIIWDGSDLVVVAESALNLRKIRSDISSLVSKQQGYYNDIKNVETQVSGISIDLAKIATSNKILDSDLRNLARNLDGSTERIDELSTRISGVKSSIIAYEADLKAAEAVADLINSGNLIIADDTDLSVSRNSAGEYIVVDSSIKVLTLLPGKNIEFDYNFQSGQYNIIGSIPPIASMIRSGKGILVKEEQSGNIEISVKSGLVTAIGGLSVVENYDGSYNVTTTPNFISGDGTRGVVVTRTSAGKFTIRLKPELLERVGNDYTTGYGLMMSKATFSLDPAQIPTLSTGYGVAVTKSTDANGVVTYNASFDLATAVIPPQPTIAGTYPIVVTSTDIDERFNVKDTKIALSTDFQNNFATVVDNLVAHINRIDTEMNSLDWDNVTLGMKMALACPMLKLFKLSIGDYDGSGLLSSNTSQVDLDLLKRYGPGTHTLNLDQDMLPYVAYSEIGSGTVLGIDSEIDLFIPLQEKLRTELGNPNFVIKESEKGTKYKIKSVGTSALTYQIKPRSELPAMSYNMEHILATMADQGWRNAYVQPCAGSAYPTGIYNSTTYPGMPLMVTGGDCDFMCGKARAGQTNGTALGMPNSGFTYASNKIRMQSVTKTYGADYIVYNMTIVDDYSGGTYNARFRRYMGSKIDMMKDYVFEEAGGSNPGWVRAFARLYANWKLNDRDLNVMVWALGAYNNCLSNYGGEFFFGNILKGANAYIFTPDYLKTVGYTANIAFKVEFPADKINYTTGKAQFKMTLTSGSVGYSAFPVNLMLNSLKFPIVYEFTIEAESMFDDSNLFSDCCWGEFDQLKYLRCGIDDQVIKPKVTTTAQPPTTTQASTTTTTTLMPTTTTSTTPAPETYVKTGYVVAGYVK